MYFFSPDLYWLISECFTEYLWCVWGEASSVRLCLHEAHTFNSVCDVLDAGSDCCSENISSTLKHEHVSTLVRMNRARWLCWCGCAWWISIDPTKLHRSHCEEWSWESSFDPSLTLSVDRLSWTSSEGQATEEIVRDEKSDSFSSLLDEKLVIIAALVCAILCICVCLICTHDRNR